jgi:hypothetical protein
MFKKLKNIFGRKEIKPIVAWETDASIFKFIKTNLNAYGTINESAETLPDEVKKENEIKFAAGLLDSMFGADDSENSKFRIKTLTRLIKNVAKYGDDKSQSDFYSEITENESVIGIIDEFLQDISKTNIPIDPYLYNYAYKLATKSKKRNAVKFGIALLGLCQKETPLDEIKILGAHDEFTVFSTIAIINLSKNQTSDLWELAKKVEGWGRIQLVDRLAELDLSDTIRDWLVYEGYQNSIMYEYLALTCVVKGDLLSKLKQDSIDDKLYKSSGELIVAMLDEGPAAGISAYDYPVDLIEEFIRHSNGKTLNISNYITLNRIKNFLEDSPEENEALKKWKQDELSNQLIEIDQIIKSKDWTDEIYKGLSSKDNVEYWNAKQAAKTFGIDLRETVWKRLRQKPLDSTSWYDLTTNSKAEDVNKIVDAAIKYLPLSELSTGPSDSLGIGPEYQKHQSLDFVITYLENHKSKGEELLIAGLKSPVTRNRNMAIRTLNKWGKEYWTETIKNELQHLKGIEPNTDTRENLIRLLNGQELK